MKVNEVPLAGIWATRDGAPGALAQLLIRAVNGLRNRTGDVLGHALPHPKWTVAELPNAAANEGASIYVSNEAGGPTLAFSDGTNWRRVQDRAIVS